MLYASDNDKNSNTFIQATNKEDCLLLVNFIEAVGNQLYNLKKVKCSKYQRMEMLNKLTFFDSLKYYL